MRTKSSAALIACAIAAGSVMFSAPAASAAAYCSSSGYTAIGAPYERCTSLSNGVLYHKSYLNSSNTATDIWTTYSKTGGSAVSVKLGYSMSGSTVYAAASSISSGQTVQKHWSKSGNVMCTNSVGMLSYSGGTYQTPAAHC